jgi:hypothetical protein
MTYASTAISSTSSGVLGDKAAKPGCRSELVRLLTAFGF